MTADATPAFVTNAVSLASYHRCRSISTVSILALELKFTRSAFSPPASICKASLMAASLAMWRDTLPNRSCETYQPRIVPRQLVQSPPTWRVPFGISIIGWFRAPVRLVILLETTQHNGTYKWGKRDVEQS